MPAVSVVVVNWNTGEPLRRCLASICGHSHAADPEIIVVDNASTDGSREMIRKEFPDVTLLENSRNVGFAAACNLGSKRAEGEFLLFLNPDARVHTGTLDGAVDFMRAHPDAGVMGCRTLNPDGTLQPSAYPFPTPLRAFAWITGLNRIFRISKLRGHRKTVQPDYVQGSFLLMPRAVFETAGGFDEGFFFYAEEVDLCRRVRDAGRGVYYYPGVCVTHEGGASAGKNPFATVHYAAGVVRLHAKHGSARSRKRMIRAVRAAARIRFLREFACGVLRLRRPDERSREVLRALLAVGRPTR